MNNRLVGAIAAAGLARPLAGVLAIALAAAPGAAAFGAAQGSDVRAVTPYSVVVKTDGAALRCSDSGSHYAVRLLKAGDVLRVDGERGGWLRCEYPAGTLAYVPAKDARLESDGKTLRLSQPSTLMALNVTGIRPWWPLLPKDLPAGTTFADAQALKAADGTVEGYSVAAPAQARGYVRSEQVRRASADEARPAGTPPSTPSPSPSPVERPAPAPSSSPAATTPPQPKTQPAPTQPAPNQPAPTQPAPTPPSNNPSTPPQPEPGRDTGTNPLPAMNPPPEQPISVDRSFENVGSDGAKRVTTPPTGTLPPTPTAQQPPAPKPSRPPAPTQSPELTQRIADLELLRDMFNRAMKPSSDEAELGTVEREFDRTLMGLGSTPDDQRLKVELNKRKDAISLKRQALEAQRAAKASGAAFDQRVQTVRVAMQEVERLAVYTIVGTMIPSTVYDGSRGLPLMFRIESPDMTSTRTVGYVIPRTGLDLIGKTGRVVGIVGESKLDPALGVNIVLPTRVDVLRFVEGRYKVESSETIGGAIQDTGGGDGAAPVPPGQRLPPQAQPQPGSGRSGDPL